MYENVFQAQEFYLYALYNKNKPKSDELMSEYAAKFFRVCRGSRSLIGVYCMVSPFMGRMVL